MWKENVVREIRGKGEKMGVEGDSRGAQQARAWALDL